MNSVARVHSGKRHRVLCLVSTPTECFLRGLAGPGVKEHLFRTALVNTGQDRKKVDIGGDPLTSKSKKKGSKRREREKEGKGVGKT